MEAASDCRSSTTSTEVTPCCQGQEALGAAGRPHNCLPQAPARPRATVPTAKMELVTASTMLSMLALVAAAYTVLDLVVFAACPAAALSDDPAIEHHRIPPVRLGRSLTRQLSPLAGNCLLVVLFALQHSVLASKALKR